MNAMELLETRASNGKLGAPAPDGETLDRIVAAALRAPDHGAVRPWKILTIRGDARVRLGEVFSEALRRSGAEAKKVERARNKPLRAPLIVVVVASPRPHPKAPESEQIQSAAALTQTLLLGLHATGFAGIWRTGPLASDGHVKQALGLRPDEHIVGFVYAGTPTQAAPEMARPRPEEVLREWRGPAM